MENTVTKINMVEKEIEVLFNQIPEPQVLLRQTKYNKWEQKPFIDDGWIFKGTENSSENILDDTFDSISTKLPDRMYSKKVCAKLARTYPLHFGDIGNDSLHRKFSGITNTTTEVVKNPKWLNDNDKSECDSQGNYPLIKKNPVTRTIGQLNRQILEDCTYSNGKIRIPQPLPNGTISVESQYRVDKIVKFAFTDQERELKFTSGKNYATVCAEKLAKMYAEIGFTFKQVVWVNTAIKNRNRALYKHPWDLPLGLVRAFPFSKVKNNADKKKSTPQNLLGIYPPLQWGKVGITLLECAEAMKNLRRDVEIEDMCDETYESWSYHDSDLGSELGHYVPASETKFNSDGIVCELVKSVWKDTTELFNFQKLDSLASNAPENYDLAEEVNPETRQSKPYTYWNNNIIPEYRPARGRKTYRQFNKVLQAVWNKSVAKKKLPALQKYAKKRFTPSQRREVSNAIQQQYA
jgi:hypothetical protein